MVEKLVPAQMREHTLERERWERFFGVKKMQSSSFLFFLRSRSVQLPVFQESVLEGETLFLALAPFLKVEINVGALKNIRKKDLKCEVIL